MEYHVTLDIYPNLGFGEMKIVEIEANFSTKHAMKVTKHDTTTNHSPASRVTTLFQSQLSSLPDFLAGLRPTEQTKKASAAVNSLPYLA